HRHAAARNDAETVGGFELQIAKRRPKDDATNLRRRILQREVEMPGVPDPAVRELAFDPDFEELSFQKVPHAHRQLGDAQDPASGDGRFWYVGRVPWTRQTRRVLRTRPTVLVFFKRESEEIAHLPSTQAAPGRPAPGRAARC